MHYANNGTYRHVSVIYWRMALALLGYSPTLGEEVVEEAGSRNGATSAGGIFLAETKIKQNYIAPRSRITFWSCFCAADALHVSPTWNSSAVEPTSGSKIEEQPPKNSGATRKGKKKKKRGSAHALFRHRVLSGNFRGELETTISTLLRTSRKSK